ncbi:HEPN domain-containing protein [Hymenobacter sp. UYCo722]|uniref:HEPN domain-containing protein n=1 Tax=Hymenobacter sp. UYCo722 TaxID=3156335 RepID=UPI00339667B3
MTKADHIAYWMNAAAQNWQEVGAMFAAGTYVPCLFWAHLTIEKLAKALWVQDNPGDTPPFTHNIARLAADRYKPSADAGPGHVCAAIEHLSAGRTL